MSLSAPGGRGYCYVRKTGETLYNLLSRITNFQVSDTQPNLDQPEDAFDLSVGPDAPSVGSARVGAPSWTMQPPDLAGPAYLDWRDAYYAETDIEVLLVLGEYELIAEQSSGANATTVAIATTGIATLAKKGTGNANIPENFGTSETVPGSSVIRRGHVLEIGTEAYHVGAGLTPWDSTKRRATLIGDIASGIAAPKADRTISSAIAATDDYKIHKYAARLTGRGRVLSGADFSISNTGVEVTGSFQPNGPLGFAFQLKANAV